MHFYYWLRSQTDSNDRAASVTQLGNISLSGGTVGFGNFIRPAFKLKLSSILFASGGEGGKSGTEGDNLSVAALPSGAQKLTIMDGEHDLATASVTLPADFDSATMKLKLFTETINGDNLTDYASAPVEVEVILVNAVAPSITSDLSTSQVTYEEGAMATALDVTATVSDGGTVSYQWYSNDTNDTATPTAVGINSAAYTPSTATGGTTYYYCVVTNTITDNGDGGSKTATTTSAIANIKVNALTHSITVTAGTGGSISPSGSVTVNNGQSKSFTITPNSNYSIADVRVDGVSSGNITTYTFSNVTANHTILATFGYNGGSVGSSSVVVP